jgi:hypothetical protein
VSGELEALIDSARRHPLKPSARQRTKMKGVVLGVGAFGAAGASALSLTKLVIAGAIATGIGSAATLGVAAVTRPATPRLEPLVVPPPPERAIGRTIEVQPVEPPARVPVHPRPAAPAAPPVSTPADEATVDVPPRSIPRTVIEPAPSQLTRELQLLRLAMDALDAKDFAAAAAAIDRYNAEFQHGALTSEVGVLRVEVLCATDKVEEATRLAAALARSDPENPMLSRIATSCVKARRAP